jgi:hypothetical protein
MKYATKEKGMMKRAAVLLSAFFFAAQALAAEPAPREENSPRAAEVSRSLHGNARSGIYHNSSCKYFTCKACTVVFTSPSEARAKGFRACKVCGG